MRISHKAENEKARWQVQRDKVSEKFASSHRHYTPPCNLSSKLLNGHACLRKKTHRQKNSMRAIEKKLIVRAPGGARSPNPVSFRRRLARMAAQNTKAYRVSESHRR